LEVSVVEAELITKLLTTTNMFCNKRIKKLEARVASLEMELKITDMAVGKLVLENLTNSGHSIEDIVEGCVDMSREGASPMDPQGFRNFLNDIKPDTHPASVDEKLATQRKMPRTRKKTLRMKRCPECGDMYKGNIGLGIHRSKAHKVRPIHD